MRPLQIVHPPRLGEIYKLATASKGISKELLLPHTASHCLILPPRLSKGHCRRNSRLRVKVYIPFPPLDFRRNTHSLTTPSHTRGTAKKSTTMHFLTTKHIMAMAIFASAALVTSTPVPCPDVSFAPPHSPPPVRTVLPSKNSLAVQIPERRPRAN